METPFVVGRRFTDSEQQRLFQAIQLYVSMFSTGSPEPDCPALQLVEDALKMPFTGTCVGNTVDTLCLLTHSLHVNSVYTLCLLAHCWHTVLFTGMCVDTVVAFEIIAGVHVGQSSPETTLDSMHVAACHGVV
jgi:hypothetical protein